MPAAGTSASQPAFKPSDLVWVGAAALLAGVLALAPAALTAVVLALLFGGLLLTQAVRRPEVLASALMAAAALDVTGRLGKVAGITVTAYQALLLVVGGATVWLLATGRARFRPCAADGFIALMLLAALFSLPAALEPRTALVALVSFYSSVAVAYFIRILAPDARALRTVLVTLLVVAAVLGVLAVAEQRFEIAVQGRPFQPPGDGIRARVTFEDPNLLGGMLAAAAAAAVPLVVSARTLARKGMLAALALAAVAGLIMTYSRGAWLGFAVGAAVAVLIAPMRLRTRLALIAVGAAGVVVALLFVLDPQWVADKVLGVLQNRSATARIYLLQIGLDIFRAYPLGIGPGMFGEMAQLYKNQFLQPGLLQSHTTVMTVLVELGIGGFVGFVGALGVAGWRTLRAALTAPEVAQRVIAAAVAAGGSALLVQSFTYSFEGNKFVWLFVGAGLAIAASAADSSSESKEIQ